MVYHVRHTLGLPQISNLEVTTIILKKYKPSAEEDVIRYFLNKNIPITKFKHKGNYSGFSLENRELLNAILKTEKTRYGEDGIGKPDLVLEVESQLVFIEVKSENDTYKREQAWWAKEHPNFLVILLFVVYYPMNTFETEDELNKLYNKV